MIVAFPAASAVGHDGAADNIRAVADWSDQQTLAPQKARQLAQWVGVASVRETVRLRKLAAEEAARLRKLAEEEAIRRRKEAAEDARVTKEIVAEAKALTPGTYVWRPERAATGPVEMVASLEAQRLYVFRSGKLIAVSTVSTGKPGNATPTGTFPILQKKKMHFSNLYDNAPMPNMQRLTWDGVALHAGRIPGHAASHGCIRLPSEFSRLLYGVTTISSIVHVIRGTPPAPGAALAFAAGGGAAGSPTAHAH
jgi:lipoprotein-anchoring transpeptidase ErfK/SrfK